MTEYDYSPEAYEKHLATLDRIARWVDETQAHADEFRSPVPHSSSAESVVTVKQGSYPSMSFPPSRHPQRQNTMYIVPPPPIQLHRQGFYAPMPQMSPPPPMQPQYPMTPPTYSSVSPTYMQAVPQSKKSRRSKQSSRSRSPTYLVSPAPSIGLYSHSPPPPPGSYHPYYAPQNSGYPPSQVYYM